MWDSTTRTVSENIPRDFSFRRYVKLRLRTLSKAKTICSQYLITRHSLEPTVRNKATSYAQVFESAAEVCCISPSRKLSWRRPLTLLLGVMEDRGHRSRPPGTDRYTTLARNVTHALYRKTKKNQFETKWGLEWFAARVMMRDHKHEGRRFILHGLVANKACVTCSKRFSRRFIYFRLRYCVPVRILPKLSKAPLSKVRDQHTYRNTVRPHLYEEVQSHILFLIIGISKNQKCTPY